MRYTSREAITYLNPPHGGGGTAPEGGIFPPWGELKGVKSVEAIIRPQREIHPRFGVYFIFGASCSAREFTFTTAVPVLKTPV